MCSSNWNSIDPPASCVSSTLGLALAFGVAALLGGCADANEPDDATAEATRFRVALTDLETDLELHWTFEDRTGSQITDVSGNGRHGTLESGSFVSSPWGDAVSLTGDPDYISLTGPRDPSIYGGASGDFTISARIKVDDASKYNTLCFGCGPFGTMYAGTPTNSDVLSGFDDQSSSNLIWVDSTGTLTDDTWVTVTMVVEGDDEVRYYLDCDLDATIDGTDIGLADFNYSSVGEGSVSNRWFEGEIDDLRIWSRALTDTELLLVCTDTAEPLCNGASEGPSLVSAPNPPVSSYTLPNETFNTTAIYDAADLEAEIDAGTYTYLVLEDGFYDHADLSGDYLSIAGHKLWARNPGEVVLNFGIDGGSTTSGAELHGLVFDIDDLDHAVDVGGASNNNTAAFSVKGSADGAVIEDCRFDGNRTIARAISAYAYDGLTISRVEIEDFTRYGVRAANTNVPSIDNPMTITDVWIRNIGDPDCWGVEQATCGYYPGTQESGLFLGDEVTVNRAFIRDVRGAGVTTVDNIVDSTLSNLDIDRIGVGHSTIAVGIYFEDETESVTVEDFCIGPNTRIGVNSEWDHNVAPRGLDNIVQDGLIESYLVGVNFDQGTVDGLVQRTTFRNYSTAGIVFYNNLTALEEWDDYDDGSTQANNTFEEDEEEGVICDFTRSHWNSSSPTCE